MCPDRSITHNLANASFDHKLLSPQLRMSSSFLFLFSAMQKKHWRRSEPGCPCPRSTATSSKTLSRRLEKGDGCYMLVGAPFAAENKNLTPVTVVRSSWFRAVDPSNFRTISVGLLKVDFVQKILQWAGKYGVRSIERMTLFLAQWGTRFESIHGKEATSKPVRASRIL